jgi:hypothetical protein
MNQDNQDNATGFADRSGPISLNGIEYKCGSLPAPVRFVRSRSVIGQGFTRLGEAEPTCVRSPPRRQGACARSSARSRRNQARTKHVVPLHRRPPVFSERNKCADLVTCEVAPRRSAPKIVRWSQTHADTVVALEFLSTGDAKTVTTMPVPQVILTVQSEVTDHGHVGT